MKQSRLVCLLVAFLALTSLRAQDRYRSPVIHPDRTVTFQLFAPEAREVLVKDIAPLGTVPMERDEAGMWSLTVGPLQPRIYYYTFSVDGARVLDPMNREIKKWLECKSEFEIPGEPPLLHELQEVPHGSIHHHFYDSEEVGRTRELYVYTPPGFDPTAERAYPVLYLMHGYGDDASAWTENGRLHFIADNLIAAGRLEPLIIVMPDGHPIPPAERGRRNSYSEENRALYEADLFDEIIPLVEAQYPIATDRSRHAIAGLSMGGGHALTMGLNHLDEFASFGIFSSACPTGDIGRQLPALRGDAEAVNEQIELLWIACGDHDFLLERNEAFVAWLEEASIEHVWRLTEAGGHDWKTWRKHAVEFLPLLFQK